MGKGPSKKELGRFADTYKAAGKEKQQICLQLILNAVFMEEQLTQLQAQIREKGVKSEYQNGENQWGEKKSVEVDVYRIGDVVVKSAIWRTFIADSLGGPSPEPPEPQQAWVDQVMDAAQTVETAVVNGPKIQDGNWWVWDFSKGAYVDTGVAASSSYTLPTATSDTLGGVKADPAQAGDTQPVRIGKNGMLYTAGAKNPVHINLDSYGAPVVFAVLSMIGSGIKEYALPLPDAPEILALISDNPDNAFFDILLPGTSEVYSAAISGYTSSSDTNLLVWADTKIAIYLDNLSGITGWIGGYLGILPAQPDDANLLIRLTDVPGSG